MLYTFFIVFFIFYIVITIYFVNQIEFLCMNWAIYLNLPYRTNEHTHI